MELCQECYVDNKNRIAPLLIPLDCLARTYNTFVELKCDVLVLNMIRIKDCKGGIFRIGQYKSQNCT